MFGLVVLAASLMCACGGGGSGSSSGGSGGGANPPTTPATATPTITTAAAQGGASIVSIADTTSGAKIYYTLDGSTPTTSSQVYQAPFLVSSSMTVNAMAASGTSNSAVATQAVTASVASGTLVWSEEFANSGTANTAPNSALWTYDTGFQCCGNNEQETYCAPTSNTSPCSSTTPNAFLGTEGYLHVVAQKSGSAYTSARLKTQGLFSVMYGRIEARMKLPESQGMWPAFWMLGNNIATINWPACGELDIMEHIDGSNPPASAGGTPLGYDWIAGSVHGGSSGSNELNGTQSYHPSGFSAADWHTYGMIWKKGEIDFYVDSPSNVYTTFKSTDATWANNMWPFDAGPQFIILNLAVGGDWPGNVDSTTVFPSEMLVDYVHVYAN